jgi:glycosyltransferase involved in cell wall biosynthesis
MGQHQHILFSYCSPPMQGPGSPIIMDRHLKRLSNDWKISIIAPEQSFVNTDFPDSWQVIRMPMRRWWWPPYRLHISKSLELRFLCWRLECERVFFGERPTAIVTILKDIYSIFAAYLSKAWQIPLYVIVHDREELWSNSDLERRWIRRNYPIVLNQATKIWPVSEELGSFCKVNEATKITTLIPIPEGKNRGFAKWADEFKTSPVVAYAGSIYPSQVAHFRSVASKLEKLGGTLLLITPKDRPGILQLLDAFPNIEHREPFAKNSDVIDFLARRASCVLVPYPLNLSEHPWAATCFPSKLVEFSHLGLPIFILAPAGTALGNWAIKHGWYSYLSDMDEEKLFQMLRRLTEKTEWIEMAKQSQAVAQEEFNPDLIQAQFESELSTGK